MHEPSSRYLHKAGSILASQLRAVLGDRVQRTKGRWQHRDPARPGSLLPAVLVTALALAMLLWLAPEDERQAHQALQATATLSATDP